MSKVHSVGNRILLLFCLLFVASQACFSQVITVSEQSAGFARHGTAAFWHVVQGLGLDGQMLYTQNNDSAHGVNNYGDWAPALPKAANYEVYAYIPRNYADTKMAKYEVHYSGGVNIITINQASYVDQWVSLGTYRFDANPSTYVRLVDQTNERYLSKRVGFDSVKWEFRSDIATNAPDSPKIVDMRMVSDHLLRVSASVANKFKYSGSKRELEIHLSVNGSNLTKRVAIQTASDVHDVYFDLAGSSVRRFTDNVVASSSGIDIENGKASSESPSGSLKILLPTILIPGISLVPSGGGENTFPEFESSMKSAGYSLRNESLYPTLYTLAYARLGDSLDVARTKLTDLTTQVWKNTYAGKINIVGHSRGGLIGRHFVNTFPSTVNHLVMVTVPNSGSINAKYLNSALEFDDMYPSWPCYRAMPWHNYQYTSSDKLNAMNAIVMPGGVDYYFICSGKYLTRSAITMGYLTADLQFLYVGDSIVPFFSQVGHIVDPSTKYGQTSTSIDKRWSKIPAFKNIDFSKTGTVSIVPSNHASASDAVMVLPLTHALVIDRISK